MWQYCIVSILEKPSYRTRLDPDSYVSTKGQVFVFQIYTVMYTNSTKNIKLSCCYIRYR